jgi:hypothetical protein
MRTHPILLGFGLLLSAASVSAAPAKKYVPPPPPVITLTATVKEVYEAQKRLASFITALQRGHRLKAASYMSSRVSQAERDAMVRKEWLRYDPTDRQNLMQVLYWRDLQIHTQRLFKEGVDLAVVSRTIALKPKKGGAPSGVLEVRMRKEDGEWRVELHPSTRKQANARK